MKWIINILAILLFTQIALGVDSKKNNNQTICLNRIHIGNQEILSALDSFICNHVDKESEQVSLRFYDNNVLAIMATDRVIYNPSRNTIGYLRSNGVIVHVVGKNPLANLSCDSDSCLSYSYHNIPPIVDGYKALIYKLLPDSSLLFVRGELEW